MEIQKNFFILLYYATGRDTKQLCSREHLGLVGMQDINTLSIINITFNNVGM